MKLLLTTSRTPSVRIRQFLKSFATLFPKKNIKIVNRGKQSLDELLAKYSSMCNSVILVTNKNGNPHKLVGYRKENDKFKWYIDFKIKFTKLHFELGIDQVSHPKRTYLIYININDELKNYIDNFFDQILNDTDLMDENNLESSKIEIFLEYENPGYHFSPVYNSNNDISPFMVIEEIVIQDQQIIKRKNNVN